MVVNSMECLLCSMWNKMPYGKRYSTPVSVGEAEGALVIGYWTATRMTDGTVVRLCERHMSVVTTLDEQEEARNVAEAQRAEAVKRAQAQTVVAHTQDPHLQQRLAEVNQRREMLVASAPPVQPTAPLPSPSAVQFSLGSQPLGAPEMVIPAPVTPTIATGLIVPPQMNQGQQPVIGNPNLPQAPVQGAALIDAPCLFCKEMVLTGEVHNCPQAGAKGN